MCVPHERLSGAYGARQSFFDLGRLVMLERVWIVDDPPPAFAGGVWSADGVVARIGEGFDELLVLWAGVESVEEIVNDPGLWILRISGVESIEDGLIAEGFSGGGEPIGGGGVVLGCLEPDADNAIGHADYRPSAIGGRRLSCENERADPRIVGSRAETARVGADKVGGEEITAWAGVGGDVGRFFYGIDHPGLEGALAEEPLGFEHRQADPFHPPEVVLIASTMQGITAQRACLEIRARGERMAGCFHHLIDRVGRRGRVG